MQSGGGATWRPTGIPEDDLRAFALGELPDPAAAAEIAHLDACPACDAAVRRLDGADDSILRRLRRAVRGVADRDPTTNTTGRADSPASPDPPPGYEILGEIGRGGMGAVYLARQRYPDRIVALKVILAADPKGLARFVAEAEAVAAIRHPGVVQVFEAGGRTAGRSWRWSTSPAAPSPTDSGPPAGSRPPPPPGWWRSWPGPCRRPDPPTGTVRICFSGDGKRLAATDPKGDVRVWDRGTGAEARAFPGPGGSVHTVALNADGSLVLTNAKESPAVHLRSVENGGVVGVFLGSTTTFPTAAALSRDGRWVAIGSNDGTVRVWSAENQGLLRACGGRVGELRVWDADTGAALRTLSQPGPTCASIDLSPDGTRILSTDANRTARVWDARPRPPPR